MWGFLEVGNSGLPAEEGKLTIFSLKFYNIHLIIWKVECQREGEILPLLLWFPMWLAASCCLSRSGQREPKWGRRRQDSRVGTLVGDDLQVHVPDPAPCRWSGEKVAENGINVWDFHIGDPEVAPLGFSWTQAVLAPGFGWTQPCGEWKHMQFLCCSLCLSAFDFELSK